MNYQSDSKRMKRLYHEHTESQLEQDFDLIEKLSPVDDDLRLWAALIKGPPDTPYEDGLFELEIKVPPTYPLSPPMVSFLTKVVHPNVHLETGGICLDNLRGNWSPVWTIKTVCVSIIALLGDPEASSPLNCDAANLLRCGDLTGYNSLVRMYTWLYASPSRDNFVLCNPKTFSNSQSSN